MEQFQKAVDSLYIKKHVDLYITGSNAYLLSGELATLLSGRYVVISMLPLSFKLESVLKFMFDNVGNLCSTKKIADTGLRYYLLGTKDTDRGHLLENIVYLELLRRGYQVSLSVRDEQTLRRELAPLDAIDDHNPKYLLTLDDDPVMSYNGIRQIPVTDWLLR